MNQLPNFFNIIPVQDKKPLVSWQEFVSREQTPEEKDELMKMNPNGKVGVVCGPISRIFVLDIDGAVGEESIRGRSIPNTWTVKTPHGRHYYFSWMPELDEKVTTRVGVLDKVDVRGFGGYVVHYGWENKPAWMVRPANPPQWLIDLLPNKTNTVAKPKVTETLDNIKEGNRNASFTSLAGGLRARGYKPEDIFNLLKPKALEVGFSENELQAVCASVGRYEPSFELEEPTSLEEFMKDMEPVEWICDQMVAKNSIGFFAGLPETSKTWCLLDLAIECARGGGMWLGKFPVKPAKVWVIDQERFKGETQRRVKALLKAKGLSFKDMKDQLFLDCNLNIKIDLQHSFEGFKKKVSVKRPDLIVIDSFSTFHSREENNRMDIQFVFEKLKEIRTEFKCAILFIHHETKQAYQKRKDGEEPSYTDMAGNVAIPAAAEIVFNAKKQDANSSFIYHTKNNLGKKMAPFVVKVIDLEPDQSSIKVEAY